MHTNIYMNKFTATKTSIEDLLIIEPTVFGDERGFFMESYSEKDFQELGINVRFVQDNHSKSHRGVLRGMHFQSCNPQGKLIRVVTGAVLDVVVDLRPESQTFGQWESVMLSAQNKRQLYVPKGFAHGFLTLQDNTEFLYKCTDYHYAQFDSGIHWRDPQVGINWQLDKYSLTEQELLLSDKDHNQPLLRNCLNL